MERRTLSRVTSRDFYESWIHQTRVSFSSLYFCALLIYHVHRNRKSEILLREIEIAATIASLVGHSINSAGKKAPYFYPKSAIDELWQSVSVSSPHRRAAVLTIIF